MSRPLLYKKIYVPVDNSAHSNACIDIAVRLARGFGVQIVGSHVYTAKLHSIRFNQMESTLPPKYRDEEELERQRMIHDSLITRGLHLISDSYFDTIARRCEEEGIPFERKIFDGKNHRVLVEDIRQSNYDLVVIGALGMGVVKESQIGSVCERVVRRIRVDTFVVKTTEPFDTQRGGIIVAVDGSPESYGGLKSAIALGRLLDRPVEVVSVYDPYFHLLMFNRITDVLSEQAAKMFRFREQERLHEEVIDRGLAMIYQLHLDVAQKIAEEEGVTVEVTLLAGKVFEQVLRYVRKRRPWLLVVGRIGIHSDPEMDIGSNTENLLRLAPCNLLLTSRTFTPATDVKAEERIIWSNEALERMKRVPEEVRGIAKMAIHRFAAERGYSVITSDVIDEVLTDNVR